MLDSQPSAANPVLAMGTGQPSAANDQSPKLLVEAEKFVDMFGGQPSRGSKLGSQIAHAKAKKGEDIKDALQSLLAELPALRPATVAKARRFMRAAQDGQPLAPWHAWATMTRCRIQLKPTSVLYKLLQTAAGERGSPKKRLLQGVASKRASQANTQYSVDVVMEGCRAVVGTANQDEKDDTRAAVGAVPSAKLRQQSQTAKMKAAAGASIPYTPQFIVDWLYQALLDSCIALEDILGDACFSSTGTPQGIGQGQVVLWWGSHLGCVRERALIAWDYDVDLAVFSVVMILPAVGGACNGNYKLCRTA